MWIKGGNVDESMPLVNCETFKRKKQSMFSSCEERSRRCPRKGEMPEGFPWGAELARHSYPAAP